MEPLYSGTPLGQLEVIPGIVLHYNVYGVLIKGGALIFRYTCTCIRVHNNTNTTYVASIQISLMCLGKEWKELSYVSTSLGPNTPKACLLSQKWLPHCVAWGLSPLKIGHGSCPCLRFPTCGSLVVAKLSDEGPGNGFFLGILMMNPAMGVSFNRIPCFNLSWLTSSL